MASNPGRTLPRSQEGSGWPLMVTAVLAGGFVALLDPIGSGAQVAVVLGAALGVPALVLFLVRPHIALAVYLALLPLVLPVPIAAGLNAAETLTLSVLALGTLSLWLAPHRLMPTLARLRPILLPLAALIAVSLISLLVNEIFAFQDVTSALFKMVAFAMVPVLVHVHLPDRRTARLALWGAVVGGAAVGLYTLTSYVMGWSYSAQYNWNRPMGTFENWNLLGACMALLSLPTLGLAVVERGRTRLMLGLLFAVEVVVLLLSLTLGSMAGFLIGAGLVLLFMVRPRLGQLMPILLVAILTIGVTVAVTPEIRDKVTRLDERVSDRLRTYATGIMMFRDRFWWGFGSEQIVAAEIILGEADYGITVFGGSDVVPHNAFLKVGAEKGVFGVLAFVALILGALYLLLRSRHRLARGPDGPIYFGIVAGVFAFLVQNMTNDLLLHARMGILFFALLAIVDRLAPDEVGGGVGAA